MLQILPVEDFWDFFFFIHIFPRAIKFEHKEGMTRMDGLDGCQGGYVVETVVELARNWEEWKEEAPVQCVYKQKMEEKELKTMT